MLGQRGLDGEASALSVVLVKQVAKATPSDGAIGGDAEEVGAASAEGHLIGGEVPTPIAKLACGEGETKMLGGQAEVVERRIGRDQASTPKQILAGAGSATTSGKMASGRARRSRLGAHRMPDAGGSGDIHYRWAAVRHKVRVNGEGISV
jgi:hypothetical protein